MPATPGSAATKRSAVLAALKYSAYPTRKESGILVGDWRRLGRSRDDDPGPAQPSAGSEGLPAPASGRAVQRGTAPARPTGQLRVSATPDARAPQAPCRPPECLRRRSGASATGTDETAGTTSALACAAGRFVRTTTLRVLGAVETAPGGSDPAELGLLGPAAAEHVNTKDVDIGATAATNQISVRNRGAGRAHGPTAIAPRRSRSRARFASTTCIHENPNTRWLARSHHAS